MKCGRYNIEDDEQLRELLQGYDYVPPAPDFRITIRSAIDGEPKKRRTWLYGLALAPVAAALLVIFLMCKPEAPDNHMALAPKTTEGGVRSSAGMPSAPKIELKKTESPKPSDVRRAAPNVGIPPKPTPAPKRIVPKKKIRLDERSKPPHRLQAKVEEKVPEPPKADVKPAYSDSVAIVAVSNEAPGDDYSYSCTQRDSATGEVTRSAGSRTGNTVMVYVEVEPGE